MRSGGAAAVVLVVASAMTMIVHSAGAQMPIPMAPVQQDAATLFRNQCGTCHSLDPADPPRQGPLLKGVYGRKPGSLPGYHYIGPYAQADWVWDDAHLDTYLTNPQAMFAGSIMAYRQANPDIRRRIIAYLKEQR